MLSPRDDEDEDNHLCIKCNATITGLDNYIKHRKERCAKIQTETSKAQISSIDSLEPTYSLGADVFFQSLELQSSVKKTSLSRLTPPISKPNSERKVNLAIPSTSRFQPRMSPLETNLRGEDWIGGHSLKIGINEDNQTKLINAVASISGSVKKEIPTSSYNLSTYHDYKGEEDSDESEESDEDDDEEVPEHNAGGKWKPPPHYTGGKWRPASPDQEDWDIREDQDTTGTVWKQLIADDDYDAPPPGHTKGKWVPGANEKTQIMQTTIQTKGSVQYWCGPCNRRLGSRAIYVKHLMSNLHMKKVLPEHELEFAGHMEPVKSMPTDKRSSRPSRFLNENVYIQPKKKERKAKIKLIKKKRKRKPIFVNCAGCKSRVRLQVMGKHLISHYHFRKAAESKSEVYQQLILDNISAIVYQSPFQCSPCKFYTNWLSNFMQHWNSEEHIKTMSITEGRCWCSFCKFECETSQDMLHHLNSSGHAEVVSVINRSMPIIIRKKSIINCKTCSKEYRYNIEVKKHCSNTDHEVAYTATDNYQELHGCQFCRLKFKSSLTLAAHLKNKHDQKAFLCVLCEKKFESSEEAKRHRQTSEHKVRRKQKLIEKGLRTDDLKRKCPYCTNKVILRNILELKEHIRIIHPNIRKLCPKCGMSFLLPQEVVRHVRADACQLQDANSMSTFFWNCSHCTFTTDSQAECFFHEALHSNPNKTIIKKGDTEKVVIKYPCPICTKEYKKMSLRCHLRQHTFERPFICSICGQNFTRQGSLANHIRKEHDENSKVAQMARAREVMKKSWQCVQCKRKFQSNYTFTRHVSKCKFEGEGRVCTEEGCGYIAPSFAQLSRHRRAHTGRLKIHICPQCTFTSSHSANMKRHMLCHRGVKPYACPHCSFTCGSLENLRKHVLRKGSIHKGLFLYICHLCDYQTNTATELRQHFTGSHPEKYDSKTVIDAVKYHLMKEFSHESI